VVARVLLGRANRRPRRACAALGFDTAADKRSRCIVFREAARDYVKKARRGPMRYDAIS